jgi:hypothetical protein
MSRASDSPTPGERRSEPRDRSRMSVRVEVAGQALVGTTVDRAEHGLLLVSEDELVLEVHVEGQAPRRGRLVRAVGVGGGSRAWAIALDPQG